MKRKLRGSVGDVSNLRNHGGRVRGIANVIHKSGDWRMYKEGREEVRVEIWESGGEEGRESAEDH